ncbi:glutamine synthetase family protein [Streptomyces sp. SHP 1-2]|uniref:glutamine synthetase family protein n=1 Tax=Streptomyces sp. SHP 1-2 TaxID=2769489 RepID=UPI002238F13C|nr:glutamine synthetase family protein [Streptomyces sp. SHP 1-2]MCW5253598.1 glutamine synthetase [Streptomyces sp. SHP 1-2]
MTWSSDANTGLADELIAQGAKALIATVVDNSGAIRAKLVPAERIASVASTGFGLSSLFAVMGVSGRMTSTKDFGGPSGDMRLIPDLSAAACIDAGKGLWWAPVYQFTQEQEPVATCQRAILRRHEELARDRGLELKMSFELEFTASGPDGPAHGGPPFSVNALLELEDFMLDLSAALTACGAEPELVHPEYGDGQVEFSVRPTTPLKSADRQVLTRIVAQRVGRRHGLHVSFSPVTSTGGIGNGCHIHFSARDSERNVFASDDGITPPEAGAAMVAGLVENLPAATGLFAPSAISYERLAPGHWSGAYAAWGVENRECAVRYIPGTRSARDAAANVELKIADATCNPYLAAAALLALALDGLDRKAVPPPPISADPGEAANQGLADPGVRSLPGDLDTALRQVEESALLRTWLGDAAVDAFVAVRRTDAAELAPLGVEQRIAVLRSQF